jgi:nucleotide-binding universal stress UspA family protein
MPSLTSLVEKSIGRDFVIFHPCDFSPASEVAFAHALKIALQSEAKLDLMHVEPSFRAEKPYWSDFPAVRDTLVRWGVLPKGIQRQDVAKTGLRVRKILKSSTNPVETMLAHFHRSPPNLIVLATHQREGLARWLSKAVAEPLARRSGAMTLFIPQSGRGFISPDDGTVTLERILIPIDHDPQPQTALRKALLLARGLGCMAGKFRLVHVGSAETTPTIDLPEGAGWSHETVVRQGDIVDQILEEETHWRPDLMVLATQGHMDFLDALRGTTTERVLRAVSCPVLAVPMRRRLRK